MSDIKFFIPKGHTIPFVTWRTVSIDVVEKATRYGYVLIWWKFYIRDSG